MIWEKDMAQNLEKHEQLWIDEEKNMWGNDKI